VVLTKKPIVFTFSQRSPLLLKSSLTTP